MFSRGQKMKNLCPRGGFELGLPYIGGVRIFNGKAHCTGQPTDASSSLGLFCW